MTLKPYKMGQSSQSNGREDMAKDEEKRLSWHSSPEYLKNKHNSQILYLTTRRLTNGTWGLICYSSFKVFCIIVLQLAPAAISNQILFSTFSSLGIDKQFNSNNKIKTLITKIMMPANINQWWVILISSQVYISDSWWAFRRHSQTQPDSLENQQQQ